MEGRYKAVFSDDMSVLRIKIQKIEKIKKYNKDFFGTLNNEETWTLIGISKMSFYKYKKELIDEGNAMETK